MEFGKQLIEQYNYLLFCNEKKVFKISYVENFLLLFQITTDNVIWKMKLVCLICKIMTSWEIIILFKYDNLMINIKQRYVFKKVYIRLNMQINVKLLERILGWKISEGTLYSSSSILCWAFSFRSYSGCLMRYENREIQVPCTLLPSVLHSPFFKTWIFKMHQIFMR